MARAPSGRWRARVLAAGCVAIGVSACAGIAGIDPPSASQGTSKSTSTDDEAKKKSGDDETPVAPTPVPVTPPTAQPDSGGTSGSVPPPPPPLCQPPKVDEGQPCTANAQCCSGFCGFRKVCVVKCDQPPPLDDCNVGEGSCCVGTFCRGFGGAGMCGACVPKGGNADTTLIGNFPIPDSCCSQQLDAENDKKCS